MLGVSKRTVVAASCASWVGVAVWLALAAGSARADVIVLKGGERKEGIVTAAPGDSNAVLFQQTMGQVKIARDRIEEIVEESDSTDWREVGDQFFQTKRYEKALDAFKKAATFEPKDPQLAERTKAAEAALAREASTERRKELAKIDETLDRAEKEIVAKNYTVAEVILTKEVGTLTPSDEQSDRSKTLKTRLYKEWGFERLDKLATPTAAQYFEMALTLDPTDQQVYKQLLEIWAQMPEKTEQVIGAYEVQASQHPDDITLRGKLAAKYYEWAKSLDNQASAKTDEKERDELSARAVQTYEKAANAFEAVYASRNMKGSDVEKGLLDVLSDLYNRARQGQDYDRAIAFYKRIQKIEPKGANDLEIAHMEYYRDLKALGADDVDGRVTLAARLRAQGDPEMARTEIENLFAKYPDNQAVKDAMRIYAEELLKQVQGAWAALKCEEAANLAARCILNYGYLPDVKEEALRIQNLANVELLRLKQIRTDDGLKYKRLGDENFQRGESYRQSMVTTTINTNQPGVVNFKNEAVQAYARALEYYGKALQYASSLAPADIDSIRDNSTIARRWYSQMTSLTPVSRITPAGNTR